MHTPERPATKLNRSIRSLALGVEKVLAFIKRGFFIMTSYRLNFALTFATMISQLFAFYFIGKLLGGEALPYIEPYGGNYATFVIWGIVFQSFIVTGLNGFSSEIRNEQLMGTLELVFLSPTRLITILLCSSIWNFLSSSIYSSATILVAATFFELDLMHANWLSAIIMLTLTVLSMMGIGIISAGIVLVTKVGDPVNWIFSILSILLCGVYYPTKILPPILRTISAFLPLTYGLEGMRSALMTGTPVMHLMDKVAVLFAFILITWPLGYVVFRRGFNKARAEGSLSQY